MSYFTKSTSQMAIYASVKGPDGKVRNMGRIDRKWWAPRAWWYRFIVFPRLVKQLNRKAK